MPQMSPLMWVVLMFFFVLFYLSLLIFVYFELRCVGSVLLEKSSLVKFFILM